MFNLITWAEGEEKKIVALVHKDGPTAAAALTEISTVAEEASALAAASGSSNKAITAIGKVAGVASVGAQFMASEVTATTVQQVGAGLTAALSEAQSTGVVGQAAQDSLNALGSKVAAVSTVLANIAAAPVVDQS